MHSNPSHPKKYDCIVIGAGPGGCMAALYLLRFRRKVLVVHHGESRARWIPKIHNLPGLEHACTGRRLLDRLFQQIKKHGGQFVSTEATVEREKSGGFSVSASGERYLSDAVVLATGIEDGHPRAQNLSALRKRGVLAYCPICDSYDYLGKPIGLLARDNAGLAKMEFLCRYSDDLHVLMENKFKIAPVHLRFIKKHRIKLHRTPAKEFAPTSKPRGIEVKFGPSRKLWLRIVYVSMGTNIRDSAYSHLRSLRRTKDGFIKVDSYQRTSIPGLYAVGDCTNELFQVSVAAGHAAVAATAIHGELPG